VYGRFIQGFFVGGERRAPVALPVRVATDIPARSGAVQRFGGDGSFAVDPARVGLVRSGGKPLPDALLAKMEAALGADFSNVRVHVGPQASRIGALAFTTGNDLYFAPGQYQPDSVKGQQLIGHELAHVIQQRQGRVRAPGSGVAVVQDRALEAEADRLGMKAAAHRMTAQRAAAKGPGALQRRVATTATAAGPDRTRIAAGHRGSLIAHGGTGASMLVTDLQVDPAHRDRGIGRDLLADAARAGLRSGKSSIALSAQDSGSGRLTRWYEEMGFRRVGVDDRGYPELVVPIGRLIGATAQAKPATDRRPESTQAR